MQFQSDISDLCIERPLDLESTARGAAMLAGVGAGIFMSVGQAAQMVEHRERFEAQMTEPVRAEHVTRWRSAIRRARSTAAHGEAASREPLSRPRASGLEDDVN